MFTLKDVVIYATTMVLTLGVVGFLVEIVGFSHGYVPVILAMAISSVLILGHAVRIRQACQAHEKMLKADLELKDILYDLMGKVANYDGEHDFYEEILNAAISAITFGEKGSIVDIRDQDSVAYVAVAGFDRLVLESMGLAYQDTYLYKETNGKMDQTVIIRNSVNYNQLHANDGLVTSLIQAGTAGIRSTICTPIRSRGQVVGMLNVDSSKKNAFGDRDVKIIELFALEVGKLIQNHEMLQENLYLSHYDSMTKIYNRGYFYELHQGLYHSQEQGAYTFVTTDIDNLKEVNDAYGHNVGDRLICHFVNGVQRFLPEEAIFGRYGGDEFNLLIPGGTQSQVEGLIAAITKYLRTTPIEHEGVQIYVAFSYGMIQYPEEEQAYEQLIIKADQRMYEQKKTMKG